MKISITKIELLQVLSQHFSTIITDISILKGSSFHISIQKELSRVLNHSLSQSYLNGEQKIPAIKALREINKGMSLFEAKYAIENWDKWIRFVAMEGRLPKIVLNNEFGNHTGVAELT